MARKRSDDKRQRILQAAARVFARKGYHGARVSEIAQKARVADGTIYLYFRNKEELLAHVADHGFAILMERARTDTAQARSAEAKLVALLCAALEHSTENPAICRAVQEHRQLSPENPSLLAAKLEHNLEELVSFAADVIERGTKSGELRACNARRAARFLVESMRGAILERLREPKRSSVQADADAIVDFFLHGVGATEPR